MTRADVEVEALKALRGALPDFARRQYEAMEMAEQEIARTQQLLEEAEARARLRVEEARAALEACFFQAMLAAQQGESVDCSYYEYALRQAEEHLTRILEWQNRVRQEAEVFRAVAQAYQDALASLLPPGHRLPGPPHHRPGGLPGHPPAGHRRGGRCGRRAGLDGRGDRRHPPSTAGNWRGSRARWVRRSPPRC